MNIMAKPVPLQTPGLDYDPGMGTGEGQIVNMVNFLPKARKSRSISNGGGGVMILIHVVYCFLNLLLVNMVNGLLQIRTKRHLITFVRMLFTISEKK